MYPSRDSKARHPWSYITVATSSSFSANTPLIRPATRALIWVLTLSEAAFFSLVSTSSSLSWVSARAARTEGIFTVARMSPLCTMSPSSTRVSSISTPAGSFTSSSPSLTRVPEPDTVVRMLPVVTWAVRIFSWLPAAALSSTRWRRTMTTTKSTARIIAVMMTVLRTVRLVRSALVFLG